MHRVVRVKGLYKVYERPRKGPGLRGALRALVRPQTEVVQALKGLSFDIEGGEVLGLIGPNGAGKTTTLKIVSGVLHPTQGEVDVLGFRPARREHGFLRQISFVMSGAGFLSEVAWDLSVHDAPRYCPSCFSPTYPYGSSCGMRAHRCCSTSCSCCWASARSGGSCGARA